MNLSVSSFVIRHSSFPRKRAAFTLLEVLASIAILVAVVPTALYALNVASNAAAYARNRNIATSLGRSKMDEILSTMNSTQQPPSLSGDFVDPGAPGIPFQWAAAFNPYPSATVDGMTTSLEQLDVTVSWKQTGQPYQVTFSTLIYQNASTTTSSSGLGGMLP